MSRSSNLNERLMEAIELRRLQLVIVEAKEVVHDNVASKCRKGIGQIEWLLTSFEFLNPHRKSVDVSIDNVDEVED